jgi:diguanylate cyclase (GGDEF)-like protein
MSRRWRSEPVLLEFDHSPRALVLLYRLLNLDEAEKIREAIVEGVEWLVHADAVSLWERGALGLRRTARRGLTPGPSGLELEEFLVELPGPGHSSLDRSGQPQLDRVSQEYRDRGCLCHVRPLQAFGDRIGSVAFHCFDRRELTHGELQALRQFSDAAGVALRGAYEREKLRTLAYTDPLTGLANRRKIEDTLATLTEGPVSVLFVDFDGLKRVNDEVGYEAGDGVIAAIGQLLQAQANPEWVPGRLGGDEFVVVLPGADHQHAATEARDLTNRLDALQVSSDAATHFGGASVGLATAVPGEDGRTLLRRASEEMKAAKRRRRDVDPR